MQKKFAFNKLKRTNALAKKPTKGGIPLKIKKLFLS